ncbi:MAG: hypothetical protein PVG50_07450 [Thiohalophilus sp.]
MNSQFNYAGFVELFLESDDDHEPYGVSQVSPSQTPSEPETEYMLPPSSS